MLRSDAQGQGSRMRLRAPDIDIDRINDEVVLEIEKDLQDSSYDIISLVFLLYEVADTALQKLIVHERISKDLSSTNLNLLYDWIRNAKARKCNDLWKHEFLEALIICQLNGVVRRIGFEVSNVNNYYQPDNFDTNMYVNPMKKALYKLCENMDSENFVRLKRTLVSYKIDTTEYQSCELVILKLMSEKFITIPRHQYDESTDEGVYNIDKLIQIINKFPDIGDIVNELKELQSRLNGPELKPLTQSTPYNKQLTEQTTPEKNTDDFSEIFGMLNDLELDENQLITDNKKSNKDNYPLKNPDRVGVCIVINQEDFYLTQESVNDRSLKEVLKKRKGSSVDKMELKNTMSALKFEVITADNLDHNATVTFIKDVIKYNVSTKDSIFMLCLLSHGVRGHIYAADCVKINVEKIQNLLDSDDALNLRGIPKVMLIQACQVDDVPEMTLVADGPRDHYHLRKSDFLIYWATAPEFEAYRYETRGSLFIQILCAALRKLAKQEHLYAIFTKVNNGVMICSKERNCSQVPLFTSTLRKNLYLYT